MTSSPGPPDELPPALLASDSERERTVATLREGAEHGRLTFDELAQRTELAYDARTGVELQRLVADLPAGAPRADGVDRASGSRRLRRWNIAILGGCERKGRWRPSPRSVALAILGGVEIDLREATIEGDELELTAVAILGGIEITVPEGVEVDVEGFALLGGNEHRHGSAAVRPGGPVIRVRAISVLGGIEVAVKRGDGGTRLLRESG